jgi:hypothetical protein
VDELMLTPIGDVVVESNSDLDERGTYQIVVKWEKKGTDKAGVIDCAV